MAHDKDFWCPDYFLYHLRCLHGVTKIDFSVSTPYSLCV